MNKHQCVLAPEETRMTHRSLEQWSLAMITRYRFYLMCIRSASCSCDRYCIIEIETDLTTDMEIHMGRLSLTGAETIRQGFVTNYLTSV